MAGQPTNNVVTARVVKAEQLVRDVKGMEPVKGVGRSSSTRRLAMHLPQCTVTLNKVTDWRCNDRATGHSSAVFVVAGATGDLHKQQAHQGIYTSSRHIRELTLAAGTTGD